MDKGVFKVPSTKSTATTAGVKTKTPLKIVNRSVPRSTPTKNNREEEEEDGGGSVFKTPNSKSKPESCSDDPFAKMSEVPSILSQKSCSTQKKLPQSTKLLSKMSQTPTQSRKGLIFATDAKFDPRCVTGIPWIKPRKVTKPIPFKFASDMLKQQKSTK